MQSGCARGSRTANLGVSNLSCCSLARTCPLSVKPAVQYSVLSPSSAPLGSQSALLRLASISVDDAFSLHRDEELSDRHWLRTSCCCSLSRSLVFVCVETPTRCMADSRSFPAGPDSSFPTRLPRVTFGETLVPQPHRNQSLRIRLAMSERARRVIGVSLKQS